jgi:signal recognition particle subunit SRP72
MSQMCRINWFYSSKQDEYDTERQTNLSAVMFGLNTSNPNHKKTLDMSKHETKTFELCYNSASIQISRNDYNGAITKLEKAMDMCRKSLENDEEFDENDVEDELAIIKVQKAYCLQMNNNSDEALKLNNNVLKNK